jgi:hypothetical protein
MPFMIRRRRFEDGERSAERVRLSTQSSGVKAEISTCQVLLAADGDQQIAAAYNTLWAGTGGLVPPLSSVYRRRIGPGRVERLQGRAFASAPGAGRERRV